MANTTNTTLTTDTLFVRQLYFKDLVNNPINTNQVLLTRGDGGIYFGSPFSNQSTIPYGFTTFIGGSNLSTVAGPSQSVLWLDQGAGINIVKTMSSSVPHYFIGATAPEQIGVFNVSPNVSTGTSILNFSSLQDNFYGGRTLYFEGRDDTVVSISDTTVVFQSAYNSSTSSLQQLLSTQESVNAYTSTQLSTLTGALSTVNVYLISTGVSTLWSTLYSVQSTTNYTSSFVFERFSTLFYSTVTYDDFGVTSSYTSSLWLFVPSTYINYVSANIVEAPYIQTTTLAIGSTLINEVELAGTNTSFCSPILPDGTVSTFTDFVLFTSPYSSNTTFGIQKEFMYSESTINDVFYLTRGQQVQIGFIPYLSTQGNQLPPSIRDEFVPILQQIQIVQTTQTACEPDPVTVNYVLRNTAKLDEICATSNLWLNAGSVTISNLNVDFINGQPQLTSSFNASTFSTLNWRIGYGDNTVLSTLRVSTVMGNGIFPILTMDGVNRRVGINLGSVVQPRATLDVNGIVYAANFVTTSDRSLKWNIRDMDFVDPTDLPKAYRFASAEAPDGDIGCMADEVERVAPECVYTTPSGTKAVAYMKLVPLCFQTIRDLADRVKALEAVALSPRI